MQGVATAESCTVVAPSLVLEPGWNLTSHTLRSWVDEPCVRTATCNEIERKLPAVPTELPRSLSTDGGPSITHFFGSSEASSFRAARRTFEHKLAHGLQKLDWVQEVVRLFAARLVAFVLAAHSEHSDAAAGDHAEDAYLLAFVGRSPVPAQRDAWTDCRRIAGHVGPHPARLAHVLGNGSVDSVRGNLREVFSAAYAMTAPHNHYVSLLLERVVAAEGWAAPSRYGALLNVPFVEQRRAEIAALAHVNGTLPPRAASLPPRATSVTNYHPLASSPWPLDLPPLDLPRCRGAERGFPTSWDQGIPFYYYQTFDSWVHFNFEQSRGTEVTLPLPLPLPLTLPLTLPLPLPLTLPLTLSRC